MICMKKVKFSSHPTAKLRCHRPRGHGAARVQLALYHLQEHAEPRLSSDAILHHFFMFL